VHGAEPGGGEGRDRARGGTRGSWVLRIFPDLGGEGQGPWSESQPGASSPTSSQPPNLETITLS
jgi:hypothetical protein